MLGDTLDILLLLAALVAGFVGYRRGFVVGSISFLGFALGAIVGMQFAPLLAVRIDSALIRIIVCVSFVFALALVGQMGAFILGAHMRSKLTHPIAQKVDGVGGFIVSMVGVVLVAWLVATPLGSGSSSWIASQVRRSAVLSAVDQVMPSSARSVSDTFADAVRTSEFPDIFEGLAPTQVQSVAPPNLRLQNSDVVETAHDSIVKVRGQAPSCNRRSEGTGFVYAPHKVMTNAHVVAGADDVEVVLYGAEYEATVVVYDPQRDLAVLHVPELYAPVLTFSGSARSGDDAIVVGYPLDGPYTATAARVRQKTPITGPDIYHEQTVNRNVYAIRGAIKPGNSGGPLLSPGGDVYGVIFAVAADDPDTGYALTSEEVALAASQGRDARRPVSTQSCD